MSLQRFSRQVDPVPHFSGQDWSIKFSALAGGRAAQSSSLCFELLHWPTMKNPKGKKMQSNQTKNVVETTTN